MHLERKFQTKFSNWAKKYWTEGTACFELKVAKGKRFAFSSIKPHQLVALRLASKGKLFWKIEDAGLLQKPFDCFIIEKSPAYLVVQFTTDTRAFFMIPIEIIDKWIGEGKKSVTPKECTEEMGVWEFTL